MITSMISYPSLTTTSLTTTSLIFDAGISSPDKNLLGEQIAELKGKMTGQRVLDVEGPTTETTGSFNGSFKGTPVRRP